MCTCSAQCGNGCCHDTVAGTCFRRAMFATIGPTHMCVDVRMTKYNDNGEKMSRKLELSQENAMKCVPSCKIWSIVYACRVGPIYVIRRASYEDA